MKKRIVSGIIGMIMLTLLIRPGAAYLFDPGLQEGDIYIYYGNYWVNNTFASGERYQQVFERLNVTHIVDGNNCTLINATSQMSEDLETWINTYHEPFTDRIFGNITGPTDLLKHGMRFIGTEFDFANNVEEIRSYYGLNVSDQVDTIVNGKGYFYSKTALIVPLQGLEEYPDMLTCENLTVAYYSNGVLAYSLRNMTSMLEGYPSIILSEGCLVYLSSVNGRAIPEPVIGEEPPPLNSVNLVSITNSPFVIVGLSIVAIILYKSMKRTRGMI